MKAIDRINKRKNLYLTLVAASFLALILLAFTEKYMPADIFKTLLYSTLSVFLVGNILMSLGIRCPKCKAILGYHIVFSAGKADRCPRCQMSFDETIS